MQRTGYGFVCILVWMSKCICKAEESLIGVGRKDWSNGCWRFFLWGPPAKSGGVEPQFMAPPHHMPFSVVFLRPHLYNAARCGGKRSNFPLPAYFVQYGERKFRSKRGRLWTNFSQFHRTFIYCVCPGGKIWIRFPQLQRKPLFIVVHVGFHRKTLICSCMWALEREIWTNFPQFYKVLITNTS